jgi:hypothetical protein
MILYRAGMRNCMLSARQLIDRALSFSSIIGISTAGRDFYSNTRRRALG